MPKNEQPLSKETEEAAAQSFASGKPLPTAAHNELYDREMARREEHRKFLGKLSD